MASTTSKPDAKHQTATTKAAARKTAEEKPSAAEPTWRAEFKQAIRDPWELCRRLNLPASVAEESAAASGGFPLLVTEEYLSAIRPGDVIDPLLRQVLPTREELRRTPGFGTDPLQEDQASAAPGLLRKYDGRALLIVTGACAIHCRYCFRRNFPYQEAPKTLDTWEPALKAIADDSSIDEVILSGGDPLTLVDERLAPLVRRIDAIPYVKRLRIHTRLPVVLTSRVCESLLGWLSSSRLNNIVVIHANHSRELTDNVAAAMDRLRSHGVMLFNQAVLLAGVNDSFQTQRELCQRLIEIGVTPYYLHLLDPISGAAHFNVPERIGVEIIRQLRRALPGYVVPRLVRESPGAESKTVIA